MRVAIYARFSTDMQRPVSVDDQANLCRTRLEPGWECTKQYADEGISGTIPLNARRGARILLEDAENNRFDVLIVESLDRLSRDMVEQETIIRKLEHRGIRIIGTSDGYDSENAARKLHRGMRGLINELYLDDLRAKTHRGLAGNVARGLSAGGLPYGYRSIDADGGRKLEIDQEQALWIVWIYEQYVAGRGAKAIAAELNERRVPAPRGGTWAFSAIYGHWKKGTGILNNEIYIGHYIWNRSQWVKNPETGRRQRVERPRSEWQVMDLPELRIVPEPLWRQVKALQQNRRTTSKGRPAKALLSGMMICGCCGKPYVAISATKYGCSTRNYRGNSVCNNAALVRRQTMETAILNLLKEELLSDTSITILEKAVRQTLKARTRQQDTSPQQAQIKQLDKEIDNLAAAIGRIGLSDGLQARLEKVECERQRLIAEIDNAKPRAVTTIIPNVMGRYRKLVDDLENTVRKRPDAARQAIQAIIGEITLEPRENVLVARIGPLYQGLLQAAGSSIKVVAGAGFTPYRYLEFPLKYKG